jgi:hypothetical protein
LRPSLIPGLRIGNPGRITNNIAINPTSHDDYENFEINGIIYAGKPDAVSSDI